MTDGEGNGDKGKPPYDLEERTALFGEAIIDFRQDLSRLMTSSFGFRISFVLG